MIPARKSSLLALLFEGLALVCMSGCTVLGLIIGASQDASQPKEAIVPAWQAGGALEPGAVIDITLKDGNIVSGKYDGASFFPAEQYAEAYSQARKELTGEILLPAVDDSVTMNVSIQGGENQEKKLDGQFASFDLHYARIVTVESGERTLQLIRLMDLTSMIDRQGNTVSGESVRTLISEGKIPVLSTILIKRDSEKTHVAMNKILQIHQRAGKKTGIRNGLLIGALIDMTVLVILVSSYDSWTVGSGL